MSMCDVLYAGLMLTTFATENKMEVATHRFTLSFGLAFTSISIMSTLPMTRVLAQDTLVVASPDGRNKVGVTTHDGQLYYMLSRD